MSAFLLAIYNYIHPLTTVIVKKNLLLLCFATFFTSTLLAQELHLDTIVATYERFQKANSELMKSSWPLNSTADLQANYDDYASFIAQLDKIESDKLEGQDLINYELLRFIIQDRLDNLSYQDYLFPLNAEGGFILGMIYGTRTVSLSNQEAVDNYLAKLRDTKRYIDQNISWMRKGLDDNKVMPKLVVNNCLNILRSAVSAQADFLSKPIMNQDVDEDAKKEVRKLVTLELMPWLKKLENFLEQEYLPRTYEQVGVSNNTEGKAYYEQRVRYYTTLGMTPQEVYDTGLREVERIKSEMQTIIDKLGFEGDFADFIKFLREDPKFYAKTEQELLNQAAWFSIKAQEILPRYFNKIYRLPFTVKPVPAEIAPTYTTGRYSGGSQKDGRCGQYWVNTYNLPARPMYVLAALTLHEAVPGHHMQISLAKELEGLPKFRTTQYLSAYGEGWGLYAEYLGKEAGMYTSPYDDFGRLTYEMWRACRLVVDPGMHYFGMTRAEAVAFMSENTSLSLHEVNSEIDRYIGWPGQAVSYKIGELKIRELRKLAETTLADKFDIRDFHDLVLANGSVPLLTLERIVLEYIEEKNKD